MGRHLPCGKSLIRLIAIPLYFLAVAASSAAADAVSEANPQALRGFGAIQMTTAAQGNLAVVTFACENPERAVVFLHKFGRDLEQSATVKPHWEKVKIGGIEANILIRERFGSFLPIAVGNKVIVFTTSRTGDPANAFAVAADQLANARFFDPSFTYPVYLDRFSRYGIGSWYASNWSSSFTKGKPNTIDDLFQFVKDNGLTIQPTDGGYILRNLFPEFHQFGLPYHFAQWHEWSQDLARMAPQDLVQPGDKFTTMPHYYGQLSDGGHLLSVYRDWEFQNLVKFLRNDPLLVDWDDPNGEAGPAPFYKYWDFSEANRQNMVQYLQNVRGYDLEQLGEAWFGNKSKFSSWDQVQIPMGYEFYGWQPDDPLADKPWRVHPVSHYSGEKPSTDKFADEARPPSAGVINDLNAGYSRPDFDDKGWASFDLPGGELSSAFWSTQKYFWYRGTIEVNSHWLDSAKREGRVYLAIVTLDHSRGWKEPDRLWINGHEISAFSCVPGSETFAQVDVTDVIQNGKNSLLFLPATIAGGYYGAGDGGTFFLTTRPIETYPFKDSSLNARYWDWRSYVSWCVAQKMEKTYQAIRAEDPDRPIKMMAATDAQLTVPLQAKYGCYGHNTGEGGFFRPWDKRLGYPYGVPSSAEFGSDNIVPESFNRWVGWYTFEGNNAFDNFVALQDLMYSPVAPLWRRYLPYIKLAPRRDIKHPDIALLFSSQNNSLLSRPVSLCFDLGRGDLQSIGYSYVYANESTIRDGLIRDYPVLWDTGTWMMDPATVRQIKDYVIAGGTFVALQETGRHTFTQRDTWPITDLTGFKVRAIRPMQGTLSIDIDQPIFKRLAGENFYNRGKSVDYSDYNYADKCIALEPVTDGTVPIAHYDDGSIAIGMRRLGKGRVIVLGSPFWRDSYDGGGMWWPGESQDVFLEDMLDGLGLKPLAKSDSHNIWREHYLANNGTEEFLALFNPFKEPQTFSIEWNTVHPVSGLYDARDGSPVAGKISGNTVSLNQVTLDGLETRIIAGQASRPPQDAVRDWFNHLSLWWRPSAPGETLQRPDLPYYTIPLAIDMTGLVLSGEDAARFDPAALSRTTSPGPAWKRWAAQSVEEFRDHPDPSRRFFLHSPLNIPSSWKPGEKIELVVSRFNGVGFSDTPVDAWINGKQVFSGKNCSTHRAQYEDIADGEVDDISGFLNFNGTNALCLCVSNTGFVGEVKLRRYPHAAEEMDISGEFKTQIDAGGGEGTASLPGTMKALYGWKDDVVIPASWKDSRVFIDIGVKNLDDYAAFAINEKFIFHPVNWNKVVTWMDITPWVRFGKANRLTLFSKQATRAWEPGSVDYSYIRLERVVSP